MGALAGLYSASRRWGVERDNLRVEVAVDGNELRTLTAADPVAPDGASRSLDDVLKRFADAGATSVAVEEDTIGGLEQSRRLTIVPGADRNVTLLKPVTAESYHRILEALTAKTGFVVDQIADPDAPTARPIRPRRSRRRLSAVPIDTEEFANIVPDAPGLLRVHEPIAPVRTVGIGLDPMVTDAVQAAGLHVLGRVSNFLGATPAGIEWTLASLQKAGASTVVFTGEEVLGYQGPLPKGRVNTDTQIVADGLAAHHLNFGTVEFGKQQGDVELQRKAQNDLVRVHTVLGTEMVSAEIPSNVQRFLLAARERNIRVLFVRLFLSEPNPVEANADYVKQIVTGLHNARPTHLKTGIAHGYPNLTVGRIPRWLIGLGIAAAWLLLFDAVTLGLTGDLNSPLVITAAVVALALTLLPGVNTQCAKIAALVAGCLFPSLAVLYNDRLRSGSATGLSPGSIALISFVKCIGLATLGIVAMVGLLPDRSFLVKTDDFLGVKAVSVVPTILAALVYGLSLRATDSRPWRVVLRETWQGIVRASDEPIKLWQVCLALVGLAMIALVVMRSGNDPGVGVSPLELKLRGFLDFVMPARPRFKDLAGHPALLIGFTLAAKGYRWWAFPFLLIGTLGLSSMLDAFCHLHTPLLVALVRDLIAIVIGLLAYALVYLVLRRIPPARVASRSVGGA